MQKKTYFFAADLIRAVAIITVVIIHVFSQFVNDPSVFLTPTWWFANGVDAASRVAVPLFVMLSGQLLLHEDKTYSAMQFFKRRFYRIGIPLLVWPLLYYGWKLFINHQAFVWTNFISAFISLTLYYHLYYLYLIAGLYLLTPVLKVYMNHASDMSKKYTLGLTFLFSLSVTANRYFLDTAPYLSTVFTISLLFICYYLAGDYLRHMIVNRKQLKLLALSYLFLTFLTAFGVEWYMKHVNWSRSVDLSTASYDRYFYDYLSITVVPMSLLAYVFLMNIPQYFPRLEKSFGQSLIQQLARTSFGIYLVHPFILDILNRFVFTSPHPLLLPLWIFLIIKTLIIVLISYGIVAVGQKIFLLKTIFG